MNNMNIALLEQEIKLWNDLWNANAISFDEFVSNVTVCQLKIKETEQRKDIEQIFIDGLNAIETYWATQTLNQERGSYVN